MAVRDLIKNYLRSAQSDGRTEQADQLAWLEERRVELTKELDAGGQAVLSTSFSGQASSFDSGVPVRDRLRAVNAAIDRLNGLGTGGGGTMILPRFRGFPH
jgi:hypothetical protein